MPTRSYTPATRQALTLLGEQIRLARTRRRLTQAELAERVGVSALTIGKIERGDPGVAVGSVFEAAAIAGVVLFDRDPDARAAAARQVRDQLALLPERVDAPRRRVRDDF